MVTPVERVQARLSMAQRVVVLTGAGVSAESGVPTFRGAGGLWQYAHVEELATPLGFARDPERVWHWYDQRRVQLVQCSPNPGHVALAALEQRIPDFLLITQNVDDLHERAGSRKIEHVHGSIRHARCSDTRCRQSQHWTLLPDSPLENIPPRCSCGALQRPAVVWFGELLPEEPLERIGAYLACGKVDVALVIGTTARFPYVVRWAEQARARGALLVEINPEQTDLSPRADMVLRGPSGRILPHICAI